jgi:hypothetical protein
MRFSALQKIRFVGMAALRIGRRVDGNGFAVAGRWSPGSGGFKVGPLSPDAQYRVLLILPLTVVYSGFHYPTTLQWKGSPMYQVLSLDKLLPFWVTYERDGQQHSCKVLIDPKNKKAHNVAGGAVVGNLDSDLQAAILEAYARIHP